jgi:hypothetical protein
MTPKEKAKELYTTYIDYTYGDFNCKQCALIAVDEILEDNVDDMSWELFDIRIQYWKEVKQEIEKL